MATGTRYAGKVVVVTGGGRGIGAGIVRAFVNSGARVVICDKDESGGRALEQELPGAVFILCDVTQEDDVKTLVSETIRRFGRLDCVVNNAGHPRPPLPAEESRECHQHLQPGGGNRPGPGSSLCGHQGGSNSHDQSFGPG
ncbi:L-fucose dehydrogenase isoform X2 [Homo sapiens]|uniref:L-fucose dehydrogenase isoform X2 n=1 Tax=Homo sapiens TaxID=9606 RepID=UPI000387B6F2|nr:17-beta-hydroxysteroid dehydrogenase 14 isoform X2 [Homo sapiens]XP_054177124.1 17-beta-hydroxysteroid dehydrogenase 14 isoform X2 [Homo sapiens]|eukprot:XP_005259027.1 17-beta-hydroxysteroid dehydrogenase 14 isoform X2 [Homo sapiens]